MSTRKLWENIFGIFSLVVLIILVYNIFALLYTDSHYSWVRFFGAYSVNLFRNLIILGFFALIFCFLILRYFPKNFWPLKYIPSLNKWITMTLVTAVILFLIGSVAILTLRLDLSDSGEVISDLD